MVKAKSDKQKYKVTRAGKRHIHRNKEKRPKKTKVQESDPENKRN